MDIQPALQNGDGIPPLARPETIQSVTDIDQRLIGPYTIKVVEYTCAVDPEHLCEYYHVLTVLDDATVLVQHPTHRTSYIKLQGSSNLLDYTSFFFIEHWKPPLAYYDSVGHISRLDLTTFAITTHVHIPVDEQDYLGVDVDRTHQSLLIGLSEFEYKEVQVFRSTTNTWITLDCRPVWGMPLTTVEWGLQGDTVRWYHDIEHRYYEFRIDWVNHRLYDDPVKRPSPK